MRRARQSPDRLLQEQERRSSSRSHATPAGRPSPRFHVARRWSEPSAERAVTASSRSRRNCPSEGAAECGRRSSPRRLRRRVHRAGNRIHRCRQAWHPGEVQRRAPLRGGLAGDSHGGAGLGAGAATASAVRARLSPRVWTRGSSSCSARSKAGGGSGVWGQASQQGSSGESFAGDADSLRQRGDHIHHLVLKFPHPSWTRVRAPGKIHNWTCNSLVIKESSACAR